MRIVGSACPRPRQHPVLRQQVRALLSQRLGSPPAHLAVRATPVPVGAPVLFGGTAGEFPYGVLQLVLAIAVPLDHGMSRCLVARRAGQLRRRTSSATNGLGSRYRSDSRRSQYPSSVVCSTANPLLHDPRYRLRTSTRVPTGRAPRQGWLGGRCIAPPLQKSQACTRVLPFDTSTQLPEICC